MCSERGGKGGSLEFSLVAEVGVFEAEEVEDAVEADGVDALLGVGDDARLGVEGDAEACLADHG